MKFFQVKTSIRREDKLKKEIYVVQDDSFDLAGFQVTTNLIGFDSDMVITDVNMKNYVAVYMLNEGEGTLYEVSLEFDDIETGKPVKEMYLQEALSTNDAEILLLTNLGNPNVEITNTKKTNIVDYFKQEEEV